jgi:hypothetical protein
MRNHRVLGGLHLTVKVLLPEALLQRHADPVMVVRKTFV